MDIKRLRYFVTVAQEGQITRAAHKLHMAQPPLSQQLKLLEEQLGVSLFERIGRKMVLTEVGTLLYDKAINLLQEIEETEREVIETGMGLRGALSIGCVRSCFAHMPDRIKHFRDQYPLVTFQLRSGDSYRLAELLEEREIELAIVRLPLEMDAFDSISLGTETFVAVTPTKWLNDPNQSSINLQELAQMPLLLLHRIKGIGQYELVIDQFKEQGLTPNVVCECPDASLLLSLAQGGVGTALLPKSAFSYLPTENVKFLKIDSASIASEAACIWLKDRYLSKNAQHFIETFKDIKETNSSA